jgi:sugar/nucleoside kinase (ribokinase family)
VTRDLVLSIGRLYSDLIFRGLDALPALGEERFADEMSLVPGGGGYITAAHLAALGARAALLARIGTDPLSGAIEPALQASGVDLRWLEKAADAGPQPTVAMVKDGDRAFLSRRAGTARPATLDAALADSAARHLHIAEFATLAEIPDLVSRAKAAGLTVSLDPSWDDSLIHDPALIARCAGVDILMPNASEARAIAGAKVLDEAGALLARRFPLVVIKDGAQGAKLFRRGEHLSLRAPRDVAVLDTTGAGDAFNAGFLAAWLSGRADREALAQGIACGTISVGAVGGAGQRLDFAEVARVAAEIIKQPVHA